MGDPKQQGSLFWWALRLGWLNEIGLAAESVTKEKVYAFYHPTFQEYFAALAIADWHFFLNHIPDNPVQGTYRIFEPHWKEVILLWLGRDKDEVPDKHKEEFIKALVEFDDGFYNLYGLQAYFLAAEGVAEFADCSADEIVMQIVQWAFGYFDSTQQKWQQFYPLDKKAKKLLRKTLRNKVIVSLTQLLQNLHDEENHRKVIDNNGLPNAQSIIGEIALSLLELCPEHLEAIKAVKKLINDSYNEGILPGFLKEFEFNHQVTYLKKLILSDSDHNEKSTENYDPENCTLSSPEEIIDLIYLLKNSENGNALQAEAMSKLQKIVTGNPKAIPPLIQVIKQSLRSPQENDYYPLFKAIECISRIGSGSSEVANVLIEVVSKDSDYSNDAIKPKAIGALISIGAGNQDVFNFLITLIHNDNEKDKWNWHLRTNALGGLGVILRGDMFWSAVTNLKRYIQNSVSQNNRALYVESYWTLFYCAENMTYPAFYQAWHQQEGEGNTNTPITQTLNQADLPQSLQSAIANDSQLSQTIHLICINTSKFINPDNPAAKIYTEMVKGGCSKCEDGTPKTMAELQTYWDLLESNKRVVLVFYESKGSTSQGLSQAFLNNISKFDGAICVINHETKDDIPVKFFTPSQAIQDFVQWLRDI
ncbi:hypothetical protein [Scytonema sp. PCC 10023]|uniref:HEAT repeat domain-containing protein n=1 Tax=Scytonema sp. PCC 10023 TaxID=1680591 RepID=UPI0039C738ED